MLDTNVYIHAAAGTLPSAAAALVDRGLLFHRSVCLAELATSVAMQTRHVLTDAPSTAIMTR